MAKLIGEVKVFHGDLDISSMVSEVNFWDRAIEVRLRTGSVIRSNLRIELPNGTVYEVPKGVGPARKVA